MSALTKNIDHQIIEYDGKPAFAVVPYDQFEKLAAQYVPDASDVSFPHEVVKANINGDSLVKAWREYLGLTQQQLADRLGISQPAMARLEKPDAKLRRSTLKKIATALDLVVEQLEE